MRKLEHECLLRGVIVKPDTRSGRSIRATISSLRLSTVKKDAGSASQSNAAAASLVHLSKFYMNSKIDATASPVHGAQGSFVTLNEQKEIWESLLETLLCLEHSDNCVFTSRTGSESSKVLHAFVTELWQTR